jgi:Transcriptional regulators
MKELTVTPISSKTNVAIVHEQLERLILDGFWQPEEKLPSEFELCGKFNVGRSTIREALNILKTREFVYTVPGLGTFVNRRGGGLSAALGAYVPDPKNERDLVNVMELRLGLEPLSAALAARRANAAQLRELKKVHGKLTTCSDPELFAETDMTFHMLLTRACGNPLYENAMNVVRAFLLEQQILTSQEDLRRSKAGKFHDQLLDAVVRHDAIAAEDTMREHMDDTYIYIKSIIDTSHNRSGRWHRRRGAAKTGRK